MAERDLKLNSIRFRKESPRLVLEEHGHCEVPAGCGGVVLRWRSRTLLPIEMWLYARAEVQAYLDGVALSSARPLVGPGEHVLAFRASGLKPGEGVLMFAAIHDENAFRQVSYSPPSGRTFGFRSAADGTWTYAVDAATDDSWMKLEFDDSRWRPMVSQAFPQPDKEDWSAVFRFDKVTQLGAQGLGVDPPAETVLVRRRFTLAPAEAGEEPARQGGQP